MNNLKISIVHTVRNNVWDSNRKVVWEKVTSEVLLSIGYHVRQQIQSQVDALSNE